MGECGAQSEEVVEGERVEADAGAVRNAQRLGEDRQKALDDIVKDRERLRRNLSSDCGLRCSLPDFG